MKKNLAKKPTIPDSFYACYLLLSLAPRAKDKVYVGSTPNPFRRIRQHNGEIVGGAKKTISARPWDMVLLVHGFPNRNSALQFEWVWQHPDQSRHFKVNGVSIFKGNKQEKMLTGKLRIVSCMLHSEPFNRWPLQLHFCSDTIFEKFQQFDHPPEYVRITIGSMDSIPFIEDTDSVGTRSTCTICNNSLQTDYSTDLVCCYHDDCSMTAHILCLSRLFLDQEGGSNLIPIQGTCPVCKKNLKWGKIIEQMKSQAKGKSILPTTPRNHYGGLGGRYKTGSDRKSDFIDCDRELVAIDLTTKKELIMPNRFFNLSPNHRYNHESESDSDTEEDDPPLRNVTTSMETLTIID
jgi:structure-specific endonuclease subunit SLX1